MTLPRKEDKDVIVLESDDDLPDLPDCIVIEDDTDEVEIIHVQSGSSAPSGSNGRRRAAQAPVAAPVAAVAVNAAESTYDEDEIEGNLLSRCSNVGALTEELDWSRLEVNEKRIVVFGEFPPASVEKAYQQGVRQVFVFDCNRNDEGNSDGVLFLVAYYERDVTVPPPTWPEGQHWPLWPDPKVEGPEPVGIILKKVNIADGRLVSIDTTRVRGLKPNLVTVKDESFRVDGALYTDTYNFLTDQKVFLASIQILCRQN